MLINLKKKNFSYKAEFILGKPSYQLQEKIRQRLQKLDVQFSDVQLSVNTRREITFYNWVSNIRWLDCKPVWRYAWWIVVPRAFDRKRVWFEDMSNELNWCDHYLSHDLLGTVLLNRLAVRANLRLTYVWWPVTSRLISSSTSRHVFTVRRNRRGSSIKAIPNPIFSLSFYT